MGQVQSLLLILKVEQAFNNYISLIQPQEDTLIFKIECLFLSSLPEDILVDFNNWYSSNNSSKCITIL